MIDQFSLHLGDCLATLRGMPDNSVDSIVTDPPYGLTSARPSGRSAATEGAVMKGFMGLAWDGSVPGVDVWAECLRVLKPGGHLLAFAGTRTQHRMAVRIEDGGFEIRDMIVWVYGSGFPKSHNLDGDWQGWGTALKPAVEPITVARKPFAQTVATNVLEHGTGALNIDGCRVDAVRPAATYSQPVMNGGAYNDQREVRRVAEVPENLGRWPANLIHDGSDEVLAAFPDAPGQQAAISATAPSEKTSTVYGRMKREGEASADSDNEGSVGFKMKPGMRRLDEGSAARFFYCAKASKKDRSEGNNHPTVKPTDLMRYLCRLVTPPGGVVLDPFTGSGSTGKAAVMEGFRFIGCELDAGYLAIAKARITHALIGDLL